MVPNSPQLGVTDKDIAKNGAQLVRLMRKKMSMSESKLCDVLGLPAVQVAKVESGLYRLSLSQWHALCGHFRIPMDSIQDGFIDRCMSAVLRTERSIGDFEIPERYAYAQGSTVRSMLPFLRFLRRSLPGEGFEGYLRFKKLDPDYFLDLSHQLNANFTLDIIRDLTQMGKLTPSSLRELASAARDPRTHGYLCEGYARAPDSLILVEDLIRNIRKYEINCFYQLESVTDEYLDVSIEPEAHFKDFNYRDGVLGDSLCRAKKHYLSEFAHIHGMSGVQVEEVSCHFLDGAPKCVYRVAA